MALVASSAALLPAQVSAPIEYLRKNAGLREVRPIFSERRAAYERLKSPIAKKGMLGILSSVVHSTSEELSGYTLCSVDPKKLNASLLKQLRASKAIELVEQMPARYRMAADPELNLQWGLRAIRWFQATRPSAAAVHVAVLDTGIDSKHGDLKANIESYDHTGSSATDILGHGTHVAGTVAAVVNNGVGVAGVADCRLRIWKIFGDTPDTDGEFYVDGEMYFRALNAVRTSGIQVLNLSIGGGASSQTEQLLFRRLSQAGVFVVAAMGNEFEEGNPTSYPAAYPTVFAVGAIGADLRRASFSNTGSHIAAVAPGVNILSTLPMKKALPYREESQFAAWDGTSMATPHVAGAAALYCAKVPGALPDDIQKALLKSCRRVPAMGSKKKTSEYGSGLIDIAKLLS